MGNMIGLKEISNTSLNIALGVIFNTETKKIIIVKRKKEASISNLKWCFPGGKMGYNEDIEKELKKKIKERVGLNVENLGPIFAETKSSNQGHLLSVYYLCEYISGKPILSEELEEIKWVDPTEVESYIGKELHPNLKEYLLSIK